VKILRHASAIWSGPVPSGTGTMTLGRNGQTIPFSLKSRIEDGAGTNPEELIGAAHAGCFSMALTSLIEETGKAPGEVTTTAKVTLEQKPDGFWITEVNLVTRGSNQSLTNDEFVELALKAKATCPVSKLYSSAVITLDAALA
jgi:osmotically inducible protein OsmC